MTTPSYIPSEAYLYQPREADIKVDSQRQIFDGNMQIDAKEDTAVSQFRAYASRNHYTLTPYWSDNKILRFLQAGNFKNEKVLTSIRDYTTWRQAKLPIKVDNKLQEFLNSGFLYVHGRDHKFRPIVVFNINMLDPKNCDFELIKNALTFWFEYIIDEWMLPGQVENWIFITNLKGMGIASIAVQNVRGLFAYLQENYKCRLYKMYLINASSSVYVPWSIVKKFLDGDTVEKVQFCKTQKPPGLFTHVHPSQIEEKFGGSAPNATHFWPPTVPSNTYFIAKEDQNNLMSKEDYLSLYKGGALTDMKICPIMASEANNNIEANNKSFITPEITPGRKDSKETSSYFSLPETTIDETEDADFIEYMSESSDNNLKIYSMRQFEAVFINKIESSQQ